MRLVIAVLVFLLLFFLPTDSRAGEVYKITSSDGKTSYEVSFGGGFLGYWLTGFDPESKQFVYLSVKNKDPNPKPVATIWDHKSGETIELYRFPKCSQPLPAIKSIKDIVYFPLTSSKDFKVVLTGVVD